VSVLSDKVNAILGIASRFLDQGQSNPFIIPPHSNAAQVYTWITSLIIQNLETFDILSDVEAEDYLGRIEELPSWVPDYSKRIPHGRFIDYSSFNASGFAEGRVPVIYEQVLSATGVEIDSIEWSYSVGMKAEGYSAIKLITEIEVFFNCRGEIRADNYPFTGESRIEAVWRTLIADHCPSNAHHPPAEKWEKPFRDFAEYYDDPLSLRQRIDWNCKGLCSVIVRDLKKRIPNGPNEEDISDILHGDEFDAMLQFANQVRKCTHMRNVFRTKSGYIGLGHNSVKGIQRGFYRVERSRIFYEAARTETRMRICLTLCENAIFMEL
jgi:hypothetical protein